MGKVRTHGRTISTPPPKPQGRPLMPDPLTKNPPARRNGLLHTASGRRDQRAGERTRTADIHVGKLNVSGVQNPNRPRRGCVVADGVGAEVRVTQTYPDRRLRRASEPDTPRRLRDCALGRGANPPTRQVLLFRFSLSWRPCGANTRSLPAGLDYSDICPSCGRWINECNCDQFSEPVGLGVML